MTHVLVLLLALLLGVVAGLRSLTAPTVVAWAAYLGWIGLHGTWAAWAASLVAAVIFSVLAVGELINDKLPKTPPRTATPVFAVRLIMGGLAGAILGTAWHYKWSSLGAGVIGAVLGTLGGYQARKALVAKNGGNDLPIALLEDSVAVLGGFGIVAAAAAMVPDAL
ncbi:glycine zipper 2TM domain-containing protein [Mycobacterium bourgelatii]|uniref:Membrane protein n=1 Tax=Mycobacterium bourgelatii TaxID=1273442 RepID=A0A7I9YR38_MYCBU|nr:glycine zipper 2TM domain-containing protein [Mycobacterium bourgelatii]MCV6974419.1 glycine zipper 2TM domain-containing protein [Mycobacterium bourgelatii]GFG91118.1 membrane protein [Mycobacterium bourgelatii]